MALESPLAAQQIAQQERAGARRRAIKPVVSAHDRADVAFPHRRFELRQIDLVKIPFRRLRVETVPLHFRPAMDGEMFGASHGLDVLRIVPLQSLDKRHRHSPRQKRVFPVSLLPAAPARVAEDIDVRRPKRQPRVIRAVAIVRLGVFAVFGPRLRGNGIGHRVQQGRVKTGRHADGLGKNRGDAVARRRRAGIRSNNCKPAARDAEWTARHCKPAAPFPPASCAPPNRARATPAAGPGPSREAAFPRPLQPRWPAGRRIGWPKAGRKPPAAGRKPSSAGRVRFVGCAESRCPRLFLSPPQSTLGVNGTGKPGAGQKGWTGALRNRSAELHSAFPQKFR